MEALTVTNWINAISATVSMLATVAVAVFAWVQIQHRNDERRENSARLDAVAKYHGLLLRNRLRDAVVALDALRLHNRTLGSWRQQAQSASDFLHIGWTRLEEMASALIERHSGTSAAIDEMLRAMLAASDAARELAGPVAPGMTEE
jgi:hypothetical protein